jgi:plasmid stabilization system protein ParE
MRDITSGKNVSSKVVDEIIDELGNRKTQAARRYLAELHEKFPRLAEPAKAAKSKQAAKRAVARASTPSRAPRVSAGPTVFAYEENSVAYEFLRNTFTEEGELLAKWGMTPTLPDDLIQKTFDQWIEHLSKNTDPMFRTIDQLNLDREKFAKLRARAKKKNGAK